MLFEWILTGGVAVAVIGVLGKYLEHLWTTRQAKYPKGMIGAIAKISRVYNIMRDTVENTSFDRVLILKAENGGGIPKLGSPLYTSVVMEMYAPSLKPIQDRYTRLKLDAQHIEVLLNLYLKGSNSIQIDNLPESNLKYIYLSEGLHSSRMFYLHSDKDAMYYLTLATSAKSLSYNDLIRAESAASTIATLFKSK